MSFQVLCLYTCDLILFPMKRYIAQYQPYQFQFVTPGGTSRGVMTTRPGWIIRLYEVDSPEVAGYGECCIIPGLSADDVDGLPAMLAQVVGNINDYLPDFHQRLAAWPSIRFAIETALLDLDRGGRRLLFPSAFTQGLDGIAINGLIWMGQPEYMLSQIAKKLEDGYRCLKMKIGAIGFDDEMAILRGIRQRYGVDDLEIRVDANGAFTPDEVWAKLDALHALQVHSIEQPIRAGQWELMANVCRNSPVPVVLDEELIGIHAPETMRSMLDAILPQYIILKPGLLGGFAISSQWITMAQERGIGWWVTSALEGNIGLNAIAQWTYTLHPAMPQGLGTGQVFSNNIPSPLYISNGRLYHDANGRWDLSPLSELPCK